MDRERSMLSRRGVECNMTPRKDVNPKERKGFSVHLSMPELLPECTSPSGKENRPTRYAFKKGKC